MGKKVFTVYTKRVSGDTETPVTLFQKYVGNEKGVLLESRDQVKGRYSIIAKESFAEVYGSKGNITIIEEGNKKEIKGKILEAVKDIMAEISVENKSTIPFVGGAVGTVGYDIIRDYEKLPEKNKDEIGVPESHLLFIKSMIVYDHFHQQIVFTVLAEKGEKGEKEAAEKMKEMEAELKKPYVDSSKDRVYSATDVSNIKSNMSKEEYMNIVKKAQHYIHEGDIFQVVLSQRWSVDTEENSFTLYRKLRALNPSPYLFYFNFGEYQVAGSSPEMLVELRKGRVFTCPIAGTRKRGRNMEEDELLAKELLADKKEQSEHVMLVDLARNDMGRIAKIGTVDVTQFMKVHYYSHVMHLVSLVEGNKKEEHDGFSILSSFLPAGTLSGAPKIRAMEIIEELENTRRGIYGGAVGYFSFDGDMDMCIAIRTMVMKDKKVYMQAGAGITAESVPQLEFEESENKVRALLRALEGEI